MAPRQNNNQVILLGAAAALVSASLLYYILSSSSSSKAEKKIGGDDDDATDKQGDGGSTTHRSIGTSSSTTTTTPTKTSHQSLDTDKTPLVKNGTEGSANNNSNNKELHSRIEELDKKGKALFKNKQVSLLVLTGTESSRDGGGYQSTLLGCMTLTCLLGFN